MDLNLYLGLKGFFSFYTQTERVSDIDLLFQNLCTEFGYDSQGNETNPNFLACHFGGLINENLYELDNHEVEIASFNMSFSEKYGIPILPAIYMAEMSVKSVGESKITGYSLEMDGFCDYQPQLEFFAQYGILSNEVPAIPIKVEVTGTGFSYEKIDNLIVNLNSFVFSSFSFDSNFSCQNSIFVLHGYLTEWNFLDIGRCFKGLLLKLRQLGILNVSKISIDKL